VGTEENDPRTLTEAGRAFGILLSWLHGASVTTASIDASGTWQIDLSMAGGNRGLIVWNPNATVQFAIPSSLHAVSQHDIFGNATPVAGSTVAVGSSPILLRTQQRVREF
jgi:hypothetical protein